MGFTSQVVNIPTDLHTIDSAGAWVVRPIQKGGKTLLFQIDFYVSAKVQAVRPTYCFNTFIEIMTEMKTRGIELDETDFGINLERTARSIPAVNAQFSAPLLTNSQIQAIAQNFDPVRLSAILGNLSFLARIFAIKLISISELEKIVQYLSSSQKVTQFEFENFLYFMENQNQITGAQKTVFRAIFQSAPQSIQLPQK